MATGNDPTAQQSPINQFSVDVLNRVLSVLSEQGRTKRTNLAGKTGLNYLVCQRYINFMKMLGWIEVVPDEDGTAYVSITAVGKRVGDALSDFLEGRDPSKINYSDFADTRQVLAPSVRRREEEKDEEAAGLAGVGQDLLSPKKEHTESGRSAKILLIDDEPDVALTYKSFLTSEGYTVDAFREPEKAVEHFISCRPMQYDLVITDIRMRNMNGLRLFQCLKNIDPSVKVIFVTALDAADELVSVISPGPYQILKKPVDKQVFSKTVKAALYAS